MNVLSVVCVCLLKENVHSIYTSPRLKTVTLAISFVAV